MGVMREWEPALIEQIHLLKTYRILIYALFALLPDIRFEIGCLWNTKLNPL